MIPFCPLLLELRRLRRAFLDQECLVGLQLLSRDLDRGFLVDALEDVLADVLGRELRGLDHDALQLRTLVEYRRFCPVPYH